MGVEGQAASMGGWEIRGEGDGKPLLLSVSWLSRAMYVRRGRVVVVCLMAGAIFPSCKESQRSGTGAGGDAENRSAL